MKTGVCKC